MKNLPSPYFLVLRFLIVYSLAFFVFPISSLSQNSFPSPPVAYISDSLQQLWEDEVTLTGAVGGVIGIHCPENWTWTGGAGSALTNITLLPDSSFSFRAASISKSFVATALLILQENNSLDLDDKIDLYLDSTLAAAIPNASQISIRQLLNHTSGIDEYGSNPAFVSNLFTNGFFQTITPTQLIIYGASQGAVFFPGTGYDYSNTNFVVAALIIESVAGIAYETFIADSILTPLGLNDTYFPTTDTLLGNYMGSYSDYDNNNINEDYSYFNPSLVYGGGALVSTVLDIIHWQKSLESQAILSQSSYTEMHTFVNTFGPNYKSGLGLNKWKNLPFTILGHSGEIFNNSSMRLIEELGIYVAYNVSDNSFENNPFYIKLYDFLKPIKDSCDNFQPILSANNNLLVNQGDSILIQASTGTDYAYEWTLDSIQLLNVSQPQLQANQSGAYQVIITDGWGCRKYTNPVIINDCLDYSIEINTNNTIIDICQNSDTMITAGIASDSINWYDQSGNLLAINSDQLTIIGNNSTMIIAEGFNQLGCNDFDTIQINIIPQPSVNLVQDFSQCINTNVSVNSNNVGGTTDWFDLGGNSIASNLNTLSFNLSADTTLIAEVSNGCGMKRDTLNINLLPLPIADLGTDISVCPNTPLSFTTGLSTDSVNWYNGAGNLLLADNLNYGFSANSTSQLIAEVSNSCGMERDTLIINLLPLPIADLGADISVCPNTPLSFTTGLSTDSVNWYNGAGNLLLADNLNYGFSANSTSQLIAEVSNSCGMKRDTLNINLLPLPVADLGTDISVCPNTPLSFTTGLSTDSVNWYNGAGNLLLADNLTYGFSANSTSQLIAEVSNSCGMERDTLIINLLPLPVADLGADITGCPGLPISLSTGLVTDTVNWFDLQGNSLAINQLSYSFNISTTTQIIVSVSNICGTDQDTIEITSIPLPTIELGKDTAYCPGEMIQLFANSSSDSINWYNQQFNLLVADSDSFSFSVNMPQFVFAEAVGVCGTVLDTIEIGVQEIPEIDLGADIQDCPGAIIQLTAGDSSDWVNWYDLNGVSLAIQTQVYSSNLDSLTTIIAEGINIYNCAARDTITLIPTPGPAPNLGEDIFICLNTPVFLQLDLVSDSIKWFLNEGILIATNTSSIIYQPEENDSIIVELIDQCGTKGFDTIQISILPQPIVDLGPDLEVETGTKISLNTGNPSDLVNWYDGSGQILQINSDSFTFTFSTPITIISEVINQAGCIGRDTLFIDLLVIDGIDIDKSSQFQISPNPASEWLNLTILGQNLKPINWQLLDLRGKSILTGELAPNEKKENINISQLAEGTYLFYVNSGSSIYLRRILVIH